MMSDNNQQLNRTLSIAPMMDLTDRHCRYFHRLLAPQALLYTAMLTTGAIIHGDRNHLLSFDPYEDPLAFQVGGSDPKELAQAARIITQWGYQEINLNVGCPSDRVQAGRFGACLMAEPNLVADCVASMMAVTSLPISVKTRIGIDKQDSYEFFANFISTVAKAGCNIFIVHARKAWLKGLSPKENRSIPPINYEYVYQLKSDFPSLEIIINGEIKSIDDAAKHLKKVDGVMIGREAYQNPYCLAQLDKALFSSNNPLPTRIQIIEKLFPYIEKQINKGVPLKAMSRHLMGLFQGEPGAKSWRRYLSEHSYHFHADANIIKQALFTLMTKSTLSRSVEHV